MVENGPYPRRWASLALLLAAVFMDLVDNQIVTIALPTVQRDLHASAAALQWTASAYTLAFAVTLIAGGRLGDQLGRRSVFVAGTLGFAASSLAAGTAPDLPVLLLARAAQGLGAGLMVPQVLAFIRAEFPAAEQGRAMGLFGMTFPIGGIAGPLLGGVLTQADLFGWQWRAVFFLNVPIGLAAAVGAALVLPARRGCARGGVDLSSVLLLAAGLLALLYPLVQGRQFGWPVWSFVLMAVALPLLAAFLACQRGLQRRGRTPLIPPELLRIRSMAVGSAVMLIFYCGMGAFFVLTLYLQQGLRYSPVETALTLLPATVGIAAGNGVGMPMAARLGRRLPMAGLALLLAATAATVGIVDAHVSPWELTVPVIVYGAGLGLGASSLMLIAVGGAGARYAGAASGLVNTVVQLGMATGPATIGTLFFARLATGTGYAAATRSALLLGLALFAAALLACLLLPRGGRQRLPATSPGRSLGGERHEVREGSGSRATGPDQG